MRVVVSQPSTAPFVQQVVSAFHDGGHRVTFATTLIEDGRSVQQRAIGALGRMFGLKVGDLLRRRRVQGFPRDRVATYSRWEWVRLFCARVVRNDVWTDRVWERGEHAFDRWVSNRFVRESDVYYGYEHSSLASLEVAKESEVLGCYDVPAPEEAGVMELLAQERARFPELTLSYHRSIERVQQRRIDRRIREWNLADLIVANSEFTKRSYAAAGRDTSKVRVVPYGAPPISERGRDGGSPTDAPLRVLWAGSFSIRKGAHYLLEAWKRERFGRSAELRVFGVSELPNELIREAGEGILLSPTIAHEELFEEYLRADVLVFPTLSDGFGMVVTEALAHGCPVITTENAGASQLIQSGENGFIIPPRDIGRLASAINWCVEERAKLREMRKAAIASALQWQWSDYRREILRVVEEAKA